MKPLPEGVLSRMFSAYDNHPLVSQEDAMQAAWDASPGPALAEALRETMEWISNWDPNFAQDDEWPETRDKARAALSQMTER